VTLNKPVNSVLTSSHILGGLIVYYWLILFFEKQSDFVLRFSFLYLALVIPINLYILFNLKYVLYYPYDPESKALLFYWLIVSAVSLIRLDFATLYNVSLFALSIIIILNSRAVISVRLVNTLFLLSILGSIITHFTGNNEYGFIPGQAASSEQQNLQWRVSLFPALPESAFFSIIVFVSNVLFNKGRSVYLYAALSLYFVLLSGNRTATISFVFIVIFLVVARFVSLTHKKFYIILFATLFVFFILLVNIDVIGANFVDLGNGFWNNYFFRSEAGVQSQEDLSKTVYRGWLWALHVKIFLEKPLLGLGTYRLDNYVDTDLIPKIENTGSEAFLTSWLARVGLMILPLLVFFGRVLRRSIQTKNKYLYALCLALAVFSLGYGSFLIPYNCMFVLIFGTINLGSGAQLVSK
jgi:hypothetical protein